MALNKSKKTLLALVQAGLWEKDVRLSSYPKVDFPLVYQWAEEQSVVGLVTAGLEHVQDVQIPKDIVLTFVGNALQLEQRNSAINTYIEKIIPLLQKNDIDTKLVKGQGLAQCYERPLWRYSSDIDFLLDEHNYWKARSFFKDLPLIIRTEGRYSKEVVFEYRPWLIELHGTLRCGLASCVDSMIDEVMQDMFDNNHVRVWHNGKVDVMLPQADNDIIFVFTHFIKHFYKERMILKQICDWCRLLWTYRESLNYGLLESRIHKAGLLAEWKVFAALAVEYLGMPVEAMPMYDSRFREKGTKVLEFILKGESYNLVRDTWAIAKIFPMNTMKFLPGIFFNVCGLKIKERISRNH